ncbi:MAG: TonB-dependent receptor plug domain-containing protein [Opitutaceae bacterium]
MIPLPRKTLLVAILLALDYTQLHAEEPAQPVSTYPELAPTYVTGSHTPSTRVTLTVPLTTISLDDLNRWGDSSPIDALRKQPFSFGATNTENDSNSGTGSASANIRGLGNLSTLTLINGRRAGGNSASGFQHGGFADLNLIPAAGIEEIQIATDGTSVAYGSDAAAGTVNILLHDLYEGNRIDTNFSNTTDGDASEKSFSFRTGQSLSESTHLVLLGSWYQRNSIEARDRSISKNADRRDQGGQNQASTTFPGKIMVNYVDYVLKDGVDSPLTTVGSITDNYDVRDPNVDFYNFSEAAVAIPEVERKSFMANLSHDISDDLQFWGEFLYTDSSFMNGLAPAPWQTLDFPGFAFNPAIMDAVRLSPHLSGGVDPNTINALTYRSFELGNLENRQDKEALRGLVGLRGRLGEWNWESALLYIQTELDEHWSGVADRRILNDDIVSGAFNPFALAYATGTLPGSITPYSNEAALLNAAASPTNHYDETFWSYDLKFSGPLFEISSGSVQFATGIEYRNDSVDISIDEIFESGSNLGGAEKQSYAADRNVMAIFAETQIPLIKTETQQLDLGLSLRYENYQDDSKDSGNTNNYDALVYKAALTYQPHEAVQLHAAVGTSFRAPTLSESYGGDSFVNPIYNDPLGHTAPSSRINTFLSSNSDLDPETSTNINLGFVFEPNKARGWRLSVDYYHIESEDVIVNGAQYFVNENANGQGGGFGTPGNFNPDAPFADQVTRNSATGALTSVSADWFNAAQLNTDGIDYKLSYKKPTTSGFWQATLGVNQSLTYKLKASDGSPYESFLGKLVDPRAAGGNIIGRGSIPRYKGYLELLWIHKGFTLGGTLNYIHSLEDNPEFTIDGGPRKVDSWTTLDLVASYHWSDTSSKWLNDTTLTFGIDNVTNEAPPFAAGAFADGYDSSLYSLAGRRLRIGLSKEF